MTEPSISLEKIRRWIHRLDANTKIVLVSALLHDLEGDLDRHPSAPVVEAPANPAARPRRKHPHPLGPPPVASTDEDLVDLDELDPRIFDQLLGVGGQKPVPEAEAPPALASPGPSIDSLRLQDAADTFRRLLLKYGYIEAPPSLRALAIKAERRDREEAYARRPRPAWHEWVSKEDEEKARALEDEAALAEEIEAAPPTSTVDFWQSLPFRRSPAKRQDKSDT